MTIELEDVTYVCEDMPGVYLLLLEAAVVYVGKAIHYPSRVRTHWQGKMRFDKVLVHQCEEREMDLIEQALIKRYHPVYNRQGNDTPEVFRAYPKRRAVVMCSTGAELLRKLFPEVP